MRQTLTRLLDALLTDDAHMSKAWLQQVKRGERQEYHGPVWQWPVAKRELDRGWRNRQRNKVA